MTQTLTADEVHAELLRTIREAGGAVKFAAMIGVTPQYVHMMANGSRATSKLALKTLGLTKQILFTRDGVGATVRP